MLRRKLVLEEETSVFILVNFADLVLTAVSFYFGGSEINPVADSIIRHFGLRGMAFYKFALVTFVILVCQYIYPTHPKIARAVLIFGSVAYGFLMAYVTLTLFAHVFQNF